MASTRSSKDATKGQPKRAVKKKGAYKESKVFQAGDVLKDKFNNLWQIVEPIGQGGFGAVYSAMRQNTNSSSVTKKSDKTATFAIKIEPHENGPLFTEMHFFVKFLSTEMIERWKRDHGLSFLGVPEYFGSGSYIQDGVNHRFLVMNRLGGDISSKLYLKNKKVHLPSLQNFLYQIIDSLHYIHSNGYFHGDIKVENLLLNSNSTDHVYLVDYGLAHLCYTDAVIKPDKRKQHNGTLWFCSRDAHLGIGTKRGDLEILAYNIIFWYGFELPWHADLKKPDEIYSKKVLFMKNVNERVFEKTDVPKQVIQYFNYVNELGHLDNPDYNYVKKIISTFGNDCDATAVVKRGTDVSSVSNGPVTRRRRTKD